MNEIEVVAIPGNEALTELDLALSEATETGFHPILLGDAGDYEKILEQGESGLPAGPILREAVEIWAPTWFQSLASVNGDDPDATARSSVPQSQLVTHLDSSTGSPKTTVLFGVFKIPAPWHAFAHMSWGGWNTCPPPAIHCAVHRYWMEQYDSKVVSITSEAVQCHVGRPPGDKTSAMNLAREQSLYCRGLVPGKSLADLASRLINAKYWYFNWK